MGVTLLSFSVKQFVLLGYAADLLHLACGNRCYGHKNCIQDRPRRKAESLFAVSHFTQWATASRKKRAQPGNCLS